MPEPSNRVFELVELNARVVIVEHELLHLFAFVGVNGAEGERAEQAPELVRGQSFVHCCSPRSTAIN